MAGRGGGGGRGAAATADWAHVNFYEEIRRAHRRAALECHPDKAGAEGRERFDRVSEAFDVLAGELRALYDGVLEKQRMIDAKLKERTRRSIDLRRELERKEEEAANRRPSQAQKDEMAARRQLREEIARLRSSEAKKRERDEAWRVELERAAKRKAAAAGQTTSSGPQTVISLDRALGGAGNCTVTDLSAKEKRLQALLGRTAPT